MNGPNKLPSLMFASKVGAYLSETPFKCSTFGWAPCHTHKHWTRLERLASDKHSSLLPTIVNYRRNFIITLAPIHNTSLPRNLQMGNS